MDPNQQTPPNQNNYQQDSGVPPVQSAQQMQQQPVYPPGPQPPQTQQQQVPTTPPQSPGPQSQAPNNNPHLEQVVNSNPNSTQNTLLISEIRDGIVIMNDGTFRSVVMARSINFDLMSPEEREAVEFAYQGFLNSLYFDVQIFLRSQKIDMRPYLERLEQRRANQENMLVALLTEDYMNYVDALAQQTNIMDKKFYVVIPFNTGITLDKPLEAGKKVAGGFFGLFKRDKANVVTINEADLEKAKQELKNRVQSIINGLAQCGVQALPLDTKELIELYYDYYNPDTATRQQLKNFDGMNTPVITKGAGGQQ